MAWSDLEEGRIYVYLSKVNIIGLSIDVGLDLKIDAKKNS